MFYLFSFPLQPPHSNVAHAPVCGENKIVRGTTWSCDVFFCIVAIDNEKEENLWIKIEAINFGLAKTLFREQCTYLDWRCQFKKRLEEREWEMIMLMRLMFTLSGFFSSSSWTPWKLPLSKRNIHDSGDISNDHLGHSSKYVTGDCSNDDLW